jgi:DNA-binding CsgD family transcriptional regulator
VLVHREKELDAIERWLSGVNEGEGGVALLEGPAGIGKTALLRAVRERAEEIGLTVLHACGGELERSAAWAVARELLLPGLMALDERDREELWRGPAAPAAAVLEGAPAEDWHGPDQAFRVAHALTWVVVALAERRPLVLVIDDAHWGDPPSLRWLEFLARRLDGVRTLVLLAARPAEGAADRALESLSARARVLRPRPLGLDAVHEVVAAHFGGQPDPEFVAACQEVTGGNPFLLIELLREASEARLTPRRSEAERVRSLRPVSVTRLLLLRLGSVDGRAPDLARAVSVLGDGAVPTTAAALADLSEEAVIAAAEALTAAQFFTSDLKLSFVHPLVRSVVYEDIAPARRAAWHRKAARLLAERGAPAGSVAAQLFLAERAGDSWAVAQLLDAAAAARRRGAPDVACDLAQRALMEPPPAEMRVAVLRELASAELDLGKVEGIDHLREALAGASSTQERAQLALLLGPTLTILNRHKEAVDLLAASLDELSADAQPELHAALEAELVAAGLALPATVHSARERIEIALARGGGLVLDLDPRILALLGFQAIGQGRIDDGLPLARHALSQPAAPSHGVPVTVNFAATALRWADELGEALEVLNHEVEDARRRSAPLRLAWAADNRAMILLRRGEVAAAEADARTAVELIDALFPRPVSVPLATHAEALMETSAPDDAVRLIARAPLGDSHSESDNAFRAEPLRVRARIRAWQGNLRGALADLERIERLAARYGFVNPGATPWRAQAALVHAALGENDQARSLVEEDADQARAVGSQRALGTALRVRGLLGKEQGLADLGEAVAILAAGQDRLEHIRALVDLGAALRRAGRRAAARAPLREALDLAARGGATALASAARTELLATGARPRRNELRGRDALTASERRIAMLASEGRSNREIAQALFVTVRTVETHLTHTYLKLGIERREQLSGAL